VNNYYGQSSSGGFFSKLLFWAIVVGIIYLLVKKVLPWINKQLGTEFKWYAIPIAILMGIIALFTASTLYENSKRQESCSKVDRLRKLSDEELMRIIDSGDSPDEARTAQIIMQSRIDRRNNMLHH